MANTDVQSQAQYLQAGVPGAVDGSKACIKKTPTSEPAYPIVVQLIETPPPTTGQLWPRGDKLSV